MAAPTSAAIRVVGRNRRQPYCADPDGQGQHERQADGRARRISHLIVAEDAEVVIEHYPEDWLAFAVFWALAGIVFLQFFTRYILNDSLAWTEEIARYGLMWVTFIGAAMVTRRNSHIAVVLLTELLPPGPARVLRARST